MAAYLTARQLAERWNCGASYVRKLCRSGVLPAMRLGSDWRISEAAVTAYEQARTSEPAEIETAAPAMAQKVKEVTNTTTLDGFTLPADYAPVFKDLWPGHEVSTTRKRPFAGTKKR